MSGSQPSSRPMSRPTWATSREWVRRVRTKSSEPAPSTWVLAPSRRSAEECSTRARSRWNGVRAWDFGGSGAKRSRSAGLYPGGAASRAAVPGSRCSVVIDSSSGGVQLRLVEAISMIGGDVPRVHPPLGDHGPLGRAGPAPGPFDGRTRVGAAPVQFGELRVQICQGLHRRQAVAHLAAHGVALEVPGHMLAKVSERAALVLEELHQQLGVAAQRGGHLAERRVDAVGTAGEGGGELGADAARAVQRSGARAARRAARAARAGAAGPRGAAGGGPAGAPPAPAPPPRPPPARGAPPPPPGPPANPPPARPSPNHFV